GITVSPNGLRRRTHTALGTYTCTIQAVDANGNTATATFSETVVPALRAQIFVANTNNGTVGTYDLDGTPLNASLITGLAFPYGLALSGNNLYVSTDGDGSAGAGAVGVYDATTGAAINSSLITGLQHPYLVTLSGNNLYVVN